MSQNAVVKELLKFLPTFARIIVKIKRAPMLFTVDIVHYLDIIGTVVRYLFISGQSNASACKKIEEGDEIVYVSGHTIVSGIL